MRLSKNQREQHKGVAQSLIGQLENRLHPTQMQRSVTRDPERIAQKINACKERLRHNPKDKELLSINLELADLFYLTNNAQKSAPRNKLIRSHTPHY